MSQNNLIGKYDIPGPRYTSYPTVPYWDDDTYSLSSWASELRSVDSLEGVSLYIHLPFCESLCTYCGCNTRITKNHSVEQPYIQYLLKEWEMYKKHLGFVPEVKEIHLGGGTPTFFSAENLRYMLESLLAHNHKLPDISVEGHPNSTTMEQLRILYSLGARRLSLGIQDFNEKVQKQINRIQTFEQVEKVCNEARKIGYRSINFDLIYGLPHQTVDTVSDTIKRTLSLKPDRIAFYSYAHVPWIKKAQKSYESFLPRPEEKRGLYELGKGKLQSSGYKEIGMDHFALETDGLYKALVAGRLHRNFMGYTSQSTKYVIGLGVSSISDIWTGFSQNYKTLKDYQAALDNHEFPAFRGHILTHEDLEVRKHILDLMCQFHTTFDNKYIDLEEIKARLRELERDGLIEWKHKVLKVTEAGRPFIRNVCMSLDMRMLRKKRESQLFSQTI